MDGGGGGEGGGSTSVRVRSLSSGLPGIKFVLFLSLLPPPFSPPLSVYQYMLSFFFLFFVFWWVCGDPLSLWGVKEGRTPARFADNISAESFRPVAT